MAVATASNAPVIDTQSTQTNPGTSTVMADTGALSAGIYEVLVMASADAAGRMEIQRRNAANGAAVGDIPRFRIAANSPAEFRGVFFVDKDERLRVMMTAALTGDAEATIFATRIA